MLIIVNDFAFILIFKTIVLTLSLWCPVSLCPRGAAHVSQPGRGGGSHRPWACTLLCPPASSVRLWKSLPPRPLPGWPGQRLAYAEAPSHCSWREGPAPGHCSGSPNLDLGCSRGNKPPCAPGAGRGDAQGRRAKNHKLGCSPIQPDSA